MGINKTSAYSDPTLDVMIAERAGCCVHPAGPVPTWQFDLDEGRLISTAQYTVHLVRDIAIHIFAVVLSFQSDLGSVE